MQKGPRVWRRSEVFRNLPVTALVLHVLPCYGPTDHLVLLQGRWQLFDK